MSEIDETPRRRLRMGPGTGLLTLLATLATFFTLTGWSDMVADPNGFLDPIGRIAVCYAVVSVVLRRLPTPRWLLFVVQAYVLWVLLGWNSLDLRLRDALLPLPATVSDHVDAVRAGAEAAQRYPSPVPTRVTEIHPLLILGGTGILVLVDLLAVTLRRVPLAGLPLLAAFTVPVAILDGFPWVTFLVAGSFFVLLLAADHLSRLSQWGRTFVGRRPGEDPAALGAGEALQRNGTLTVQIGAVALVAAVLAPLAVPEYDGLLGGGGAGGDGKGRTVSLENPIANMQRDLDQGPDVDLLFLTTDNPDPAYIRVTALDLFDADTWRPGRRELPATQKVQGDLPPPAGQGSAYRAETYGYRFRATDDLESTWLPLPFPALAANVTEGDWRYDITTRDVRAIDDGFTTAGVSYQATGDEVDPRPEALVESRPAPASLARLNTELPWKTDPAWLADLVDGITQDADSDFGAAVAMQRWFRNDNRFTYSTNNADGSGIDALRSFLTTDRTGYCEQFATAMALMARVYGIPSRVAVGFLRPDPLGPGEFVFSTHDLHAWPELYFEGAGWVKFEPTPNDRTRIVPSYTRGEVPRLTPVGPTDAPSASATPTPTRGPKQVDTAAAGSDAEGGGPSPWWPVGVVALLALLLAPRGLREASRRRRASGEDPVALVEGAWAELRATALDLGLGWDDRVTVRVRARALHQLLGRSPVASRRTSADDAVPEPAAREALDALVVAVERTRFSATPPTVEDGQGAAAAGETVATALRQRVAERTRLRAAWLPRSVTSPGRPAPVTSGEQAARAAAARDDQRDSLSL